MPTQRILVRAMVWCTLTLLSSTPRRVSGWSWSVALTQTRIYPTKSTRLWSTLSGPSSSSSSYRLPIEIQRWIDLDLPEGRCIGVSMNEIHQASKDYMAKDVVLADPDHWMRAVYHPQELDYGLDSPAGRGTSFWLGRLAMRMALDFPDYPILKDSYGRPQLPGSICGSITHKQNYGVALVCQDPTVAGVGIDLEFTSRPGKRSIATRVLTTTEQSQLGSISGITKDEEVLLRFSLKEAIYKAVHPLLCQYVSFQEAEVTPYEDGTAHCEWFLESNKQSLLTNVTAHWRRLDDGYFLTSASVQKSV